MNDLFLKKFFLLGFIVLLLIPKIEVLSQLQPNNIGDLTRQSHIEVTMAFNGSSGYNHYFTPTEFEFFTGKLYKLILTNNSDSPHYFTSNEFVKSIFTRKIQIVKNNEKIAGIKGNINNIEVYPGNSVEWWFVPIKTGIFNDLQCSVYDKTKLRKHSEMGMRGVIIIE